jgi:general secretion pathway protein D
LFKKISATALVLLAGATMALHAQQRFGGGGFGGFGGFGGGGFGGQGGNANNRSSTAYNNNGSVGSATITVDPQTHNLVIIADEMTAMQISNVIQNLDVPKPQVLIKMVFLEVQRNDGREIGVEGAYNAGHLGTGLSGSAANVLGLAGANSLVTNFNGVTGAGNVALTPTSSANGFYQIVGSDFQATLKAIATAGRAQVLSRPSVLARDGQLAKIVIGKQVYLPSGVSFTTTGTTTTPIINGNYTDIGIILNVTPFIGANNLVEMILQPQTSSVDTSSPGQQIATGGLLGSPVFAPNINIRSADTVVVTPDGQTVVIGGLIGNTKSVSESKVPILGDLPILGQLFKATKHSNDKSELLMFLTPHVVTQPSDLAALTASETQQSQIITNMLGEKELNRLLEHVPMKSGK